MSEIQPDPRPLTLKHSFEINNNCKLTPSDPLSCVLTRDQTAALIHLFRFHQTQHKELQLDLCFHGSASFAEKKRTLDSLYRLNLCNRPDWCSYVLTPNGLKRYKTFSQSYITLITNACGW